MIKRKHIVASSLLLSGVMLSGTANAKQLFQDLQPASYGGAISCSSCHAGAPQTENNVTTSYGVAYNRFVNDDIRSSITTTYNTLEPFDSDGDGFSNIQEIFAKSNVNISASTPLLTTPDYIAGDVSAKAIVGGLVSNLSLQAGIPTAAVGGTVFFESPASLGSTTTDFMLKAGGAQSGATVTFYDNNDVMIPVNTADGAGGANIIDGSVNIIVKDDGVFDLYSTAAFVNTAITRTPTFTPVVSPELINPYAQVDPYAVISPTATIDDYAVVAAYAIVDNYATIGAYAQVGSYAYIAPNVDIYTGIDINTNVIIDTYAEVISTVATVPSTVAVRSGVGYVSAKFSVITTPPTPLLLGTAATGLTDGTSGGLHCMTTGLGTQGLMFLGLLGTAFLVRRKLN